MIGFGCLLLCVLSESHRPEGKEDENATLPERQDLVSQKVSFIYIVLRQKLTVFFEHI
jgi:hypothetical protein